MVRLGVVLPECIGWIRRPGPPPFLEQTDDADLLARVDALPVRPAYVPLWCTWGDVSTGRPDGDFPTDLVIGLTRRGITPAIYWQPDKGDHRDILEGRWDAYIDAWATDAAEWGGRALVQFAHEQNGTWFPWSPGVGTNTAASYIAMWRYVVGRVRAIAPRLLWWWCPNAGQPTKLDDTWPGDEWVDRVGLDGYAWKDPLPSPETTWGAAYRAVRALTRRPLIVGEFGCASGTTGRRDWFRDTIAWFEAHDIAGAIYFSIDMRPPLSEADQPHPDWRLASTANIRGVWAVKATR